MPRKAYLLLLVLLLFGFGEPAYGQIFGEGKVDNRPKIDRLKKRLESSPQTKNNTPDKYALLICGKTYDHTETYRKQNEIYQANLSIAYQVLIENGFSPDKIFIIYDEGHDVFLYPVDGPANQKNIDAIFDYLPKVVDENDLLFVYVTGHGSWTSKGYKKNKNYEEFSVIYMDTIFKDQKMFSEEFIGKMNPKLGILLFDQCFSGGFAQETGKKNFIAIAASKANKVSYSELNQSFGGYFMKAFRDKEKSDKDRDGMISIAEAFEYAKQSDSQKLIQDPFIQSEVDPKLKFLQ